MKLVREHINEEQIDEMLIFLISSPSLNESLNESINLDKIKNIVNKIKDKSKAFYTIIQKFNDTKDEKIKNYFAIVLTILVLSLPSINIQNPNIQEISNEISKRKTITPLDVNKIINLPIFSLELSKQKLIKIDNPINIEKAHISEDTKQLIKEHEKLKLKAYSIGDGMITIGWGHAEPLNSSTYKIGHTISKKEADILFQKDLNKIENGVKRIFYQWEQEGKNIKMTQGMFDSMVSLGYNIGISGLRKTEFIQHVKNNDILAAAEKIKTTKINSKFPGLKDRRQKEHELFIKDLNFNE